jgi:ferritin-like metal-binding protein YciE
MEESSKKSKSSDKIKIASAQIKTFFISHLNRIHAAKMHLVTRLPKLADEVHYADLWQAIQETVSDVEKQIARMELIFALMDAETNTENCLGITNLVDEAFTAISIQRDPVLRDLSIIFYMQIIESIEMASFQILQITAVKLRNKQIKQLLKENYQEAKADRTLMLLIAAKYVTARQDYSSN